MGVCELCGVESSSLLRTKVAGTFMNTCSKCSRMGQVQQKSENFLMKVMSAWPISFLGMNIQ